MHTLNVHTRTLTYPHTYIYYTYEHSSMHKHPNLVSIISDLQEVMSTLASIKADLSSIKMNIETLNNAVLCKKKVHYCFRMHGEHTYFMLTYYNSTTHFCCRISLIPHLHICDGVLIRWKYLQLLRHYLSCRIIQLQRHKVISKFELVHGVEM